jgi:hypothetical protein
VSGQLLTPECGSYRTSQWFLDGTQPREQCTVHRNLINTLNIMTDRLEREYIRSGMGLGPLTAGSLTLNLDFLTPPAEEPRPFVDAREQDVYIPQLNERPLPVAPRGEPIPGYTDNGDVYIDNNINEEGRY